MNKKMTIIEAIRTVLLKNGSGMTVEEIFDKIIENKLYTFGAKNPRAVVNGEIRCHCSDLNFPTANPVKYFFIQTVKDKKPVYYVIGKQQEKTTINIAEIEDEDILPAEKVDLAIKSYDEKIKGALWDKIMAKEPGFFEQLVVNLLLKMGYGYDESSGIVVGKSHDGGIDGIINEDKLGLDLIYVQAKRYDKKTKVSRPVLQAFVGAMEGIQKGVFLTTSSFTLEAENYIKNLQHKYIKLIDGETLLSFMLKYEVGVQVVKTYNILKVDEDYFN